MAKGTFRLQMRKVCEDYLRWGIHPYLGEALILARGDQAATLGKKLAHLSTLVSSSPSKMLWQQETFPFALAAGNLEIRHLVTDSAKCLLGLYSFISLCLNNSMINLSFVGSVLFFFLFDSLRDIGLYAIGLSNDSNSHSKSVLNKLLAKSTQFLGMALMLPPHNKN